MAHDSKVRVVESYVDFKPSMEYGLAVRATLATIPEPYLQGLDAIVLRDDASLTTEEREKGLSNCQGVYLRGKGGRPPRIDIFVDKILAQWPVGAGKVPIFREEIVYSILFHELGHHLQDVVRKDAALSEEEADRIAHQLLRHSFRQRHPGLVPLARVFTRTVRTLVRLRDRSLRGRRHDEPA